MRGTYREREIERNRDIEGVKGIFREIERDIEGDREIDRGRTERDKENDRAVKRGRTEGQCRRK